MWPSPTPLVAPHLGSTHLVLVVAWVTHAHPLGLARLAHTLCTHTQLAHTALHTQTSSAHTAQLCTRTQLCTHSSALHTHSALHTRLSSAHTAQFTHSALHTALHTQLSSHPQLCTRLGSFCTQPAHSPAHSQHTAQLVLHTQLGSAHSSAHPAQCTLSPDQHCGTDFAPSQNKRLTPGSRISGPPLDTSWHCRILALRASAIFSHQAENFRLYFCLRLQ